MKQVKSRQSEPSEPCKTIETHQLKVLIVIIVIAVSTEKPNLAECGSGPISVNGNVNSSFQRQNTIDQKL